MNTKVQKMTYSVREAADALGISLQKMYELTFIAGFPVFRLGRSKRIPIEQLNDWIRRNAESQNQVMIEKR